MTMSKIEYVTLEQKKKFSEIEQSEFFSQGSSLCRKLFNNDIAFYKVQEANVVSVLTGMLCHLDPDEEVYPVILEHKHLRLR